MRPLKSACVAVLAAVALLFMTARAFADDALPVPIVRLAMGPAVHFEPEPRPVVHYALDVTAGIAVFGEGFDDDASWVLSGELGYTFETIDGSLHAFNLAPGIGYGSALIGVRYNPRLLAGTANGERAIGMRNSLTGFFLLDSVTLEVGHQFFDDPDGLHHDIHIQLGVNPAAAIFVFLAVLGAVK